MDRDMEGLPDRLGADGLMEGDALPLRLPEGDALPVRESVALALREWLRVAVPWVEGVGVALWLRDTLWLIDMLGDHVWVGEGEELPVLL